MKQNNFCAKIHKTIKINVDDDTHALPPSKGVFVEHHVAEYDCPTEWSKDGVFIEVKEGEPMWFDFIGNDECAIIVSVQKVNPITGEKSELKLSKDPKQNYLKMPEQRWLDGYSNDGKVYQFVVTKSGIMSAVNEYVLPLHEQDSYAIGFAFFDLKNPKPKISPVIHYSYPTLYCEETTYDYSVPQYHHSSAKGILRQHTQISTQSNCYGLSSVDALLSDNEVPITGDVTCDNEAAIRCMSMGSSELLDHTAFDKASMGQGGRIVQEIVTDNNTIEYYVSEPSVVMNYYLCLPEQFAAIMAKGKRSDPHKKDKYTHSGKVGNVQIPLI